MANKQKARNETRVIKIIGIVQGVGFRPFIVKLACALGVTGKVKNKGANVWLMKKII